MSNDSLIPRTGMPTRLIEGPKIGQTSLYRQRVLDEDTYTDALSYIITRDFFPNLPHIHATNAYLSALTNNDPELLSSSIRRLAALAQEKEGPSEGGEAARRRELQNMGTPYMSKPSNRIPVGARGWDTPSMTARGDRDFDDLEGEYGEIAGPSKKKRKTRRIHDELGLDAFQRNYTSEDNASFVQIVDEENRKRREERWGWAWEAERRAELRRVEGEERRKAILDAAVSGDWKVDGNGRRLVGGLAEPGTDQSDGRPWDKLLTAGEVADTSSALIPTTSNAVAIRNQTSATTERQLPETHPLTLALTAAGLPGTAIVSNEDGAIVPRREIVDGSGDGRGRGDQEKQQAAKVASDAMGEEREEYLSLAGSGGDIWGYKTRNNFFFPADANTDPFPKARKAPVSDALRQAPPKISHVNTRLPDNDEVRPATSREGSRRGSSPARSWVEAAVRGTPYRPGGQSSEFELLAKDPSPSPQDLPSLLTWGTLLSTPRALDGSDDPLDDARPSFRLPETKRRDEIGRKLGDKASRSMNARAQSYTPRSRGTGLSAALRSAADKSRGAIKAETPGRMLPPSSTPRRTDALTPAARQLLQRSMGVSRSTIGGTGLPTKTPRQDPGGRSWSPSPARPK